MGGSHVFKEALDYQKNCSSQAPFRHMEDEFLEGTGFCQAPFLVRGVPARGLLIHSHFMLVIFVYNCFLTFKCRPLRATFGMSAYFSATSSTIGVSGIDQLASPRPPRRIGGDHDFRVAWPDQRRQTRLFLLRALCGTQKYIWFFAAVYKEVGKKEDGRIRCKWSMRFDHCFEVLLPKHLNTSFHWLSLKSTKHWPSVSLAHSFRTCRSHCLS